MAVFVVVFILQICFKVLIIFNYFVFYQICMFLKNGATSEWSFGEYVPFAFKGKDWVGYDNIDSFQLKVN